MTIERSTLVSQAMPELGSTTSSGLRPPGTDVAHLLTDLLSEVCPIEDGAVGGLSWRLLADLADDEVRLRATLTRRSAPRERPFAVSQALLLESAEGRVIVDGSVTWWGGECPATAAGAVRRSDVCTAEWGAALRSRLDQDPAFADATRTFDGAIELVAQDRTFLFRIYKGIVLDAGHKAPNGPTFSVAASDLAWTELLIADRNDFIARANGGQFGSRGSSFEYLRMFKGLVIIVDHARAQFREESDALRSVP